MPAAPVAEPPSTPIVTPPAPTIAPSRPPPSKPPGPPPPSSAPASPNQDYMSDVDLDRLMAPMEEKAAPAPAPKTPAKPNEAPKPEAKTEPDKPAEQPKTEAAQAPKERSKMGTFRDQYDKLKSRNAELEQEVIALRQPKSPDDHPQLKTYKERLETAEKRREELEGEIRYAAYERSPEYQERYQKPFEEAYHWGRQSTAKLKVLQEDGSSRQATPDDFDKIMLLDDEEAADVAEKMFGNKDKIVMAHRWEMKKLDAARYRAIEEFRKSGTERQQKMAETEAKDREFKGQLWSQLNQTAADKYPQWFKAEDGDDDGNRLLEEGYKLADAAFSNGDGMTPEQTVKLHASLRNRAAAFTREVYRNNRLNERIKELETKLAEFEQTVPGPGEGKAAQSAESGFEELRPDA